MARKPSVKNQPTGLMDLMGLALTQLDTAISRPNILSWDPYPAQLAFHQCDKTGRYLSAGNRAGKTTASIIEAIWWATNTHPYLKRPPKWGKGPLRMRWVVVDVEKGVHEIILPELKRWTTASMLVNGSWEDSWNNTALKFTFANGSTIQFLTHGMDLDKHGGVPLHMVFFDEIPPHSIFIENMMRLIDYEGLWVLAATSVDGMGWTYEYLWEPQEELRKSGQPYDVGCFMLSQKDNPYLQTSIERRGKYFLAMDENERRIREEGEFTPRAGRIFPNWNIHDHVLDAPWIPPREWRWYTSVDFGWSNPTAWLWHAVAPDGRIYTFAEHYKSEMTPQEHSKIVLAREAFWHVDSSSILRVGDPNNGNAHVINGISYVSEYANNGVFIGTENIPRDVEPGILKMQQYIRLEKENGWGKNKPRWMISPNCVNLIRELKKLRRESYESTKKAFDSNKKEGVHKKDDHAFDSARYFFTFMPDLAPSIQELIDEKAALGINMSYEGMIQLLRSNDRVVFEEDQDSEGWETELVSDFEEV